MKNKWNQTSYPPDLFVHTPYWKYGGERRKSQLLDCFLFLSASPQNWFTLAEKITSMATVGYSWQLSHISRPVFSQSFRKHHHPKVLELFLQACQFQFHPFFFVPSAREAVGASHSSFLYDSPLVFFAFSVPVSFLVYG